MEKRQKISHVMKLKEHVPAKINIISMSEIRFVVRKLDWSKLQIRPSPPGKFDEVQEDATFQYHMHKTFEDLVQRDKTLARSVYERALDANPRDITLWLAYVEMEMKNRQVDRARNMWNRAVLTLPQENELWDEYTTMEEILENITGAREVFERWMECKPDEQAWQTYINFELRHNEVDRARALYERFVIAYPTVKNWIEYARFEASHGYIEGARRVYERGNAALRAKGDVEAEVLLLEAWNPFEMDEASQKELLEEMPNVP